MNAPVQDLTTGHKEELINIIKQSYTNEGGTDFSTFIKKLATLLKDPNNKLIQFGKTAFLLLRKQPGMVEVHTFSAEPAKDIARSFQGLAKFLKSQNIKKAVTYADNPAYSMIAKQTGLPVKMGQSTKQSQGKSKPVYTFEVEL